MNLLFTIATDEDAAAIAALRNSVADHLTRLHGHGHWSGQVTEKGVLRDIQTSRVLVSRTKRGRTIVGTLLLASKKPWAIDPAYFVKVPLIYFEMVF